MLKLPFTKMHALGNDFVILDATQSPINLTTTQLKLLADRKYGVGCDQVLLIEPGAKKDTSCPTFKYHIFNADGTEAEQCGNGARCVIEYLYNNHSITSKYIKLETITRTLVGKKTKSGIEVSMGYPSYDPKDLPFTHESNSNNQYTISIPNISNVTYGIISMGNPHAIVQLTPQLITDKNYMTKIANYLQSPSLFPESVNVNFFTIINQQHIKLITYERVVGFTHACGSGACATVSYGVQQGILDSTVTVDNEGGKLYVSMNKKSEVFLSGEVTTVFSGEILM